MATLTPPPVATAPHPRCPACGSEGPVLHAALRDRWFGIPGEWRMRRCAGSGCGVCWLDPAPVATDLPRLYERYYTHGESGGRGDVLGRGWPRRARLAHLAARFGYRREPAPPEWLGLALALVPGRREYLEMALLGLRAEWRGPLLDVGCGSGESLRLMCDLGWDAEGVDLDARAVEVARANGLAARVGTVDHPDLRHAHYAAITSSHVLEHVPDPRAFLARCRELVRPGGRLALATPNVEGLGARWFGARWRGLEPPRHLQVLTRHALQRLAGETGWQQVRVTTSARLAGMVVRETLRPETVGLAAPNRAGLAVRTLAGAFQWCERLMVAAGRPAGEELLLTARAPGGAS